MEANRSRQHLIRGASVLSLDRISAIPPVDPPTADFPP